MRARSGGTATGQDAQRCAGSNYRLSLIIPAWNEQETILQAIREADTALSTTVAEYEILVIDDGSTDRTAEVVRAEAGPNPHVRLVQHPRNLGYGAALRSGFQAAAMDLVAFTDADCQFDLNEFEYVLPLTRRYDVTCGYRIDRQDSARRRFFSWGYNVLVTMLLGSQVHDLDCALKVFRRERLRAILPEYDNFFVNAEMLTKARQQGLSVVEVGVHHRPRAAGHSKVSVWEIPKTLSALVPFWWSRVLFPAPDRSVPKFGSGSWAGLLFLGVLAGLLLFLNLSYPLIKPDERRYADIGREMLASGDWIVPTLNHEPYYDKPPLYYWLTVGSFHLFGISERSARLVPALATLLTIFVTFVFGTRLLGPRAGFLAGLVLTLTTGFVQCGRFIVLDSLFSLFLVTGLFTAYEAVRCQKLRWSWWLASAICCALGVLTKGPVALVLLVPPAVAHGWLARGALRPALRHWMTYAALVLALAAPWYLTIMVRAPAFAYYFFIDQNLRRFFTDNYHDSPFWFYVPVVLIGGLPWSLLLFPFGSFLFSRSPQVGLVRERSLGFLLLFAGWCVLFFSLSRGKLPPYILPVMPPLAVLLGYFLDHILSQASFAALFREGRCQSPRRIVTFVAEAWLLVGTFGWWKGLIGSGEYVIESAVCISCILGVKLWGRRMHPKLAWALCGLAVAAVTYETSHELVPAWSYRRSPLALSGEFAALLRDGDTAVAAYGHEWCSVPLDVEHDDVPSFTFRTGADLKSYLGRHQRSLLVTKSDRDRASMAWAIPPGMAISRVLDAGDTRVFVIEAVSH